MFNIPNGYKLQIRENSTSTTWFDAILLGSSNEANLLVQALHTGATSMRATLGFVSNVSLLRIVPAEPTTDIKISEFRTLVCPHPSGSALGNLFVNGFRGVDLSQQAISAYVLTHRLTMKMAQEAYGAGVNTRLELIRNMPITFTD